MQTHASTTPFGRRAVSLGQIATQLQVQQALNDAGKPGSNAPAAVNKWQLFRTLTDIRARLGVSDRSLSVLNALLSFHPETALTLPKQASEEEASPSCDLVVFPSNRQLCLRAHGMAEKTLRNHLAQLVVAGLIIRRDSPNGKRYARKDASGAERFSDAFGFDLIPLITRAASFEAMAEELKRERRATSVLKERISLHRRDITKLITLGLDESLEGDWEAHRVAFMQLLTPLRRIREHAELITLEASLSTLHAEVSKALESCVDVSEYTGNDGFNYRHQSNSKTESHTDLEPASNKQGGETEASEETTEAPPEIETKSYPLGMVLEACPDVNDYRFTGGPVRTWPAFIETMRTIRPMLGISPDAWEAALQTFGTVEAHIVLATILQRSEHSSEMRMTLVEGSANPVATVNGSPAIKSAGGYLRSLTDKAREGAFALGPVLMALIGQRMRVKRGG
ncbi:MAG: plasmid replication protein RepC [Beijerinckiaceae bacterium]